MPAKTTRPGLRRKLSASHRIRLFNYAMIKFTDPALRAVEEQAREALVASLLGDYDRVLLPHMEVLDRFAMFNSKERLNLPFEISEVVTGPRTFDMPDGSTVTRPASETYLHARPAELDIKLYRISDIQAYAAGSWPRDNYGQERRPKTQYLELGRPIKTRGADLGALKDDKCKEFVWVSLETRAALLAYFKAAKARLEAEDTLRRAIAAMILSANLFGELVVFWPEANDLLDDLFAEVILPNQALVAINDDQKALLCQNMAGRGVESALCAVAA